MTDKHIDRYLTLSPVEQLFRELNQISFKTEKPRNPEYRYRYRYWYRYQYQYQYQYWYQYQYLSLIHI